MRTIRNIGIAESGCGFCRFLLLGRAAPINGFQAWRTLALSRAIGSVGQGLDACPAGDEGPTAHEGLGGVDGVHGDDPPAAKIGHGEAA